jgi:4'-phosphopantetheinyl transferase
MTLPGGCATHPAHVVETVEDFEPRDASIVRPLAPSQIVVAFAAPESGDAVKHARMMEWLSTHEKERLRRFRFERDRQLFLLAHALLRSTLSRYGGVEPAVWQFRVGPYGRPEIAAPVVPLRFSLAHTAGLATCAVTLGHDVGVDVEEIVIDSRMEVAGRYFAPVELADLGSVSADQRALRFFEYWTLKEAYLKARGVGLSVPLDSFSLCRDVDNSWRLTSDRATDDEAKRWSFWSWRLGQRHQVALAVAPHPVGT